MKFVTLALLQLASLGTGSLFALESGLDKVGRDMAVRPQDDLFLAMNGCWLKNTEIPADRSNYGSFSALEDLSRERIRTLIEELATKPQVPGSEAQKIGDLYKSVMDEARIEALGLQPIQAQLAAVAAIKSNADVALHCAEHMKIGVRTPIHFSVDQDSKDSTHYLVAVHQSGTGLPDRDYYLKDDAKYVQARAAYVAYAARLLELSGETKEAAAKGGAAILELETALAKAQRTRVELRDPNKNYNKTPLADLEKSLPSYPWKQTLAALGVSPAEINVRQPEFVSAAAGLIGTQPVEVWRQYLTMHLVNSFAQVLPKAVRDADFELHGKVLAGIQEEQPRWKKAVAIVGGDGAGSFGALGDAVGHAYVDRHFPAEAKRRMDELVGNLLKAYAQSIDTLTWMSPETKRAAHDKLSKYTVKIGYTRSWRDYSGLQVRADDVFGNILASRHVEFAREFSKFGQPVDKTEWWMTPQTVNAYYSPSMNEIVFPAAILQPPFFNALADDAVNYGGIGAVIGHEISHGFDDKGSQYDGEGNLRNWWVGDDRKAFEALTKRLGAQYDACEPLPGKFLNGTFTMGENIADLSGLAVAYKAYLISLDGKAAPAIDSLSGEQRFFLGWSQVWRRKYREAELAKRIVTDPHSPSQYRANIPPSNMDDFVRVFGLKAGDKLWLAPEQRVKIW